MSGSFSPQIKTVIDGVTTLSELSYPRLKQAAPLLSQLDIPIFFFCPVEHATVEIFEQALVSLASEIESAIIAEYRRVTNLGLFLFSRGLIVVINIDVASNTYRWEMPSIVVRNKDLLSFQGADNFQYFNVSRMLVNKLS